MMPEFIYELKLLIFLKQKKIEPSHHNRYGHLRLENGLKSSNFQSLFAFLYTHLTVNIN